MFLRKQFDGRHIITCEQEEDPLNRFSNDACGGVHNAGGVGNGGDGAAGLAVEGQESGRWEVREEGDWVCTTGTAIHDSMYVAVLSSDLRILQLTILSQGSGMRFPSTATLKMSSGEQCKASQKGRPYPPY